MTYLYLKNVLAFNLGIFTFFIMCIVTFKKRRNEIDFAEFAFCFKLAQNTFYNNLSVATLAMHNIMNTFIHIFLIKIEQIFRYALITLNHHNVFEYLGNIAITKY